MTLCWCWHPLADHAEGRCAGCAGSRLVQELHAFRPIATLPWPRRR